jgi:hypothetical protein
MAYPYDPHLKVVIVNGVDDTVVALTDAVPLLSREFLASRRAGIVAKGTDPVENPR